METVEKSEEKAGESSKGKPHRTPAEMAFKRVQDKRVSGTVPVLYAEIHISIITASREGYREGKKDSQAESGGKRAMNL